jgi:type III pantothenate kinase
MQETVIIADAGNTSIKFGVGKNQEISEVYRVDYNVLDEWLLKHPILTQNKCVLSTVTSALITQKLEKAFDSLFLVDRNVQLPIQLDYHTPETLGIDRICNAVAIHAHSPNKHVASIDIGTCIKFDFVDQSGVYQGGSISPGIDLRYKSMHDYTENLPQIDLKSPVPLIGKSTTEAMHSGVINGIQAEINDIIRRYELEYCGLTFFVTGGNAQHFDFDGKNNIFADENLTLKGLNTIYLLNAK